MTVTDVDEAATVTSVSGNFVFGHDENDTAEVAAFTATDPERAKIRWTLSAPDGAVFEISDRGVLSFLRPPDFEHPADNDNNNEYLLLVQARAGASVLVDVDVRVNVANVDEPGVVVLSSPQPQIGTPLEAAVSDLDGVFVVQAWIWQRRLGGGPGRTSPQRRGAATHPRPATTVMTCEWRPPTSTAPAQTPPLRRPPTAPAPRPAPPTTPQTSAPAPSGAPSRRTRHPAPLPVRRSGPPTPMPATPPDWPTPCRARLRTSLTLTVPQARSVSGRPRCSTSRPR